MGSMAAGIAALSLLTLAGCAAHRAPRVYAESRPTPPLPDTTSGDSAAPVKPAAPAATANDRSATLARIVADTTAASKAVRRCSTRTLLPDQESVFDTARGLLQQTREALARDELWRAESLARKARQLAASLNCPG
jgi:hypothetical protein